MVASLDRCLKRSSWAWSLVALAALLAGCGQRGYSGPGRFPLAGTVTYDGQPIDIGSISFLPLNESSGQRVSGGYIFDGKYEVPEGQGANAGKYRVEIRWQKLTGKKIRDRSSEDLIEQRAEGLPAKFHKDSELTAEVSASQTKFDFDLKSQ
jgi:hypothetical protein